MRTQRLARLTLLTQGAALLGLGMSELGCAKDNYEPIHMNATATPLPSASAPAPSATVGLEDIHMNAPPTLPASASGPSAPPRQVPPSLPHMNAPPTPPIHTNAPPAQ